VSPNPETMRGVAGECVKLVGEQYCRQLDWSIASLGELDDVCATLTADGPLAGQRLELWRDLVGAYTGEVTIRLYGGQWVSDDRGLAISAPLTGSSPASSSRASPRSHARCQPSPSIPASRNEPERAAPRTPA
jgi:hypothetical protein